jgi:hypothetical protein
MMKVGSVLWMRGVSILVLRRSLKKRCGAIIVWPLWQHIKRRSRLFELNSSNSLFLQMSLLKVAQHVGQ